MSADGSITNLPDAVAARGALPMPVAPEPRSEMDQLRDDVMGACLARWEEEQENARLRLALASAQRGRRALRAEVAALLEERHRTNEWADDAAKALRANRDRIAELERPAVERHRVEVRDSYRQLAAQARQDGDYEGEAVVLQQLAEREAVWAREDELAREFAVDPLAMKPYVPGPSVGASVDKLTRLLAPSQALREPEGEFYPFLHKGRVPHDLPETGGAGRG
jgi:hypothetical protein